MKNQSEFILYSYFRSSASYRVRIALHLKKIDFEYRPVHLLKEGGEQLKADYKKLNPSGDVPTLVHNGKILGQSVAIFSYLDSVAHTPQLFPDDAYQRALVYQFCEIINSGIQPLHNLRVLNMLKTSFQASEQQTRSWTQSWLKYGLKALEDFLGNHQSDGPYCFGKQVSAADCFLLPHLANADRFEVSLNDYPRLAAVRTQCNSGEHKEAFQKAEPKNQIDFSA